MREGLNRVLLIGNLGQDPELRYTQGGDAVLNLRLATTERWTDKNGEKQERTEWHSAVMWGKRAEGLSKFLKKGDALYAEGQLQTRKWEDKQGGARYSTEVKVGKVILLGGGKDQGHGGGGGGDPGAYQEPFSGHPADDDIPF